MRVAPRFIPLSLMRECVDAGVRSPIYDGATPKTQPAMNTITKKYPPHQAHKHHYGWVRFHPIPIPSHTTHVVLCLHLGFRYELGLRFTRRARFN
jgi:hypothetical protein